MSKKHPKPEEIVSKLRQVEVLVGQGMKQIDAIREIGIVEQTFYRWRKLNSTDIIDVLTDLFILRGIPAFIRSDNEPEFIAEAARNWIRAVGAKTAYITPG